MPVPSYRIKNISNRMVNIFCGGDIPDGGIASDIPDNVNVLNLFPNESIGIETSRVNYSQLYNLQSNGIIKFHRYYELYSYELLSFSHGRCNSTAVLEIIVPPSISYESPLYWTYNSTITAVNPINDGDISLWSVTAGSLPTGISLNPTTGQLTGTPTLEGYSQTAEITATNGGGSDTAEITWSVAHTPSIIYAGSPFSWVEDVAIATASPTNTGGTITSYAVTTGALPTGISLNASTGELTGTPADDGDASVGITATGPGGTDEAMISLSVFTPADLPAGTRWWDPAAAYCTTDAAAKLASASESHFVATSANSSVQNWCAWLWVKLDSTGADSQILTLMAGMGNVATIRWYTGNFPVCVVRNSSGGDEQLNGTGGWSGTGWHLLVVWYVHSTGTIYMKWDATASASLALTGGIISATIDAIRIGRSNGTAYSNATFQASGVVFGYSPSAQDLTDLYNVGTPILVYADLPDGMKTAQTSLWRLHEATGARIDSGPAGRNLTAFGSPSVAAGLATGQIVNNAPVKSWTDRLQSTVASQATMANQPLWIADIGNGEPGIDGDGGDVLTTSAPTTSTHHEIIAAVSLDATHNTYAQAFGHGDDWPRAYTGYGSTHKPHAGDVPGGATWGSVINDGVLRCLRWYVNASAQAMNVNGGTPVTASAAMSGAKAATLGGIFGAGWAPQFTAGRVGHSIVYYAASELTAGQRSQTEAWIKGKYGIT